MSEDDDPLYVKPAPGDVTPPSLGQPWSNPPPITDNPQGPRNPTGRRGKGVPQPPQTTPSAPIHPAYSVTPSSVNGAGNQILDKASASINSYDDLKAAVEYYDGWVFWEPNPGTEQPNQFAPNTPAYDPDPDSTSKVVGAEHQLLLEAADAIALAGQFVSQLHTAAEYYSAADAASALPEIAEMGTEAQGPSPGGATGHPVNPAGTGGQPDNGPKGGGTEPAPAPPPPSGMPSK